MSFRIAETLWEIRKDARDAALDADDPQAALIELIFPLYTAVGPVRRGGGVASPCRNVWRTDGVNPRGDMIPVAKWPYGHPRRGGGLRPLRKHFVDGSGSCSSSKQASKQTVWPLQKIES